MAATAIRWALMLAVALEPVAEEPKFIDYPATERYVGKTHPLVLTRKNREYRTRLREAAAEKPNFAGHYILTAWGCGTECVMGAVIDANTGRVSWFPHTICCWGTDVDDKFEPLEFRRTSRLIVFSGARNEADGDNGAHFYELRDGRFIHVSTSLKPAPPAQR